MPLKDDPFVSFIEDDADLEGYALEGSTDPAVPLVALERLLNRPPSFRKRLLQIGAWLAALALTLLTFWSFLTPRPPVNASTAAPGSPSLVSITSNVTSGTLTINGRQQPAALPIQLPLRSQAPLVVTLDAPPFRPITCQVPPTPPPPQGAFNPCVLREQYSLPQQRPIVLLSILLGLDALPLALQQQVLTLLPRAATFQAATTTPSPSYVAMHLASDGTITSQLTQEPLQASALFVPSPAPTLQGDPFCDGRLCYAAFSAASTAHLWAVTIPVAPRWRFTSAGGQVERSVAYPVIEGWQLDLTYTPGTGWQVPSALNTSASAAKQFSSLSCATGAALLQAQVTGLRWTIRVAHQAGLQGCQSVGQQEQTDRATFVWRFGVLLAADALAQQILPALPVALPADTAAVGA